MQINYKSIERGRIGWSKIEKYIVHMLKKTREPAIVIHLINRYDYAAYKI